MVLVNFGQENESRFLRKRVFRKLKYETKWENASVRLVDLRKVVVIVIVIAKNIPNGKSYFRRKQ